MKIDKIHTLLFSPSGTTRRVVTHLTKEIAALLPDIPVVAHDFTLPSARENTPCLRAGELAIVGLPVYAGRLPNLLLKYLATWKSNGTLAVPVVVYGNRSFDNALIELCDILENGGFHTIAAAAFVGQHAFSKKLATGRPDREDLKIAGRFAAEIVRRVTNSNYEISIKAEIPGFGAPGYGGYYQPRGINGEVVNFLKAKPLTTEGCIKCKHCVGSCPMGSIDFQDPGTVSGICIKCNACIKYCPMHAKYFADTAFLSHVHFLENTCTLRAEIRLF